MADMKLSVNFMPEGNAISKLVEQVQSAFGSPIKVQFQADTSRGSSGLSSVNALIADSAIKTNGLAGAKRRVSIETAREIAQTKINTAAIKQQAAERRQQEADANRAAKQAEQTVRKAATAERKTRQDALDFAYLKRQSEDYFKTYEKNILKNKDLTAEWAAYNNQKFKDPLEQRQALQDMMARTREAGAEVESLGQRIKRLFGQHFDTALVMVGINALRQALQQVYQNVVQLDKAVVDLQIATGGSRSDMQALLSDYSKLGQEIGATTLEVAQSADTWLNNIGLPYRNVWLLSL